MEMFDITLFKDILYKKIRMGNIMSFYVTIFIVISTNYNLYACACFLLTLQSLYWLRVGSSHDAGSNLNSNRRFSQYRLPYTVLKFAPTLIL